MKKIEIIRKSKEFEKIIKKGKNYKNDYFIIFVLKKAEKKPRMGIAIPKNIGKAAKRNKIKRQVKSIIDKKIIALINNDCIILVKKEILNLKYIEKEKNLITLFNLIKEEEKK